MPKITRETLQTMKEIKDEDRNEILAIFDDIAAKTNTIEELRRNAPKDSQQIVEKGDYKKLQETISERDKQIQELSSRLSVKKEFFNFSPLPAFWE